MALTWKTVVCSRQPFCSCLSLANLAFSSGSPHFHPFLPISVNSAYCKASRHPGKSVLWKQTEHLPKTLLTMLIALLLSQLGQFGYSLLSPHQLHFVAVYSCQLESRALPKSWKAGEDLPLALHLSQLTSNLGYRDTLCFVFLLTLSCTEPHF